MSKTKVRCFLIEKWNNDYSRMLLIIYLVRFQDGWVIYQFQKMLYCRTIILKVQFQWSFANLIFFKYWTFQKRIYLGVYHLVLTLSLSNKFNLSKNMLQGQLTYGTFYNSSSLVPLDLSYNYFNDSIPSWIDRLSQLSNLILANNHLESEVPIQLCRLKQLRLTSFS